MADSYQADYYAVDTDVLRDVASRLGGEANRAATLLTQAKTAEVPSGSWGLLGESLGLHNLYNEVRDQADATLDRIHDFLAWSAEQLCATASDYDEQESSIASNFRAIGGGA